MLLIGYTTREHLLLDLDETSEGRAAALAQMIIESWPCVGDCLVVESSTPSQISYIKYDDKGIPHEKWVYQNYHLVFDSLIGYDVCLKIIDTLVDLDLLNPEYKQIRMFRGDMTLRVSAKWLHHRIIPSPIPVNAVTNTEIPFMAGGVARYLHMLHIGRIMSWLNPASSLETQKTGLPPLSTPWNIEQLLERRQRWKRRTLKKTLSH
jgi:hypothetical protein